MRSNLWRKGLVLGIILLFIYMSFLPCVLCNRTVLTKTICVPEDYPTIEDAMNSANDGDTILVLSGIYYENVVIDKSINLVGYDKESAIIDGGWNGDVVYISANNVGINGFTIKNSGKNMQNAGIRIHSSFNEISCNKVTDNNFGIYVDSYSRYNKVFNNSLVNNKHNAHDSCSSNRINMWSDGCCGNFWSDYKGIDNNLDGIGDTTYKIYDYINGSNYPIDNYPRMYPWYSSYLDVIYVNDDYNESTENFGYDRFNKIQYAVETVQSHGTVYVYPGVYYEHVIINRPIKLKGIYYDDVSNDNYGPIIDGQRIGSIITIHIQSNKYDICDAEISGFIIQNSANYSGAGVMIHFSKDIIIKNCLIRDNQIGVYFYNSGKCGIRNNVIEDNRYGIVIELADHCDINFNWITDNSNYGVYCDVAPHCDVKKNKISGNENGLLLARTNAKTCSISGNNFINNLRTRPGKFWSGLKGNISHATFLSCYSWMLSQVFYDNYYDDYMNGWYLIPGLHYFIGVTFPPILMITFDKNPSTTENNTPFPDGIPNTPP